MVHLIVFVVEVSIRDQCLIMDLFQKKQAALFIVLLAMCPLAVSHYDFFSSKM